MERAMQQSVPHAVDDEPLLSLRVTLQDGSRFEAPAAPGFNLMELLRMYGLPVKAECGGAGVCATCHVRIPPRWQRRLPAPSEEELAKLDEIPDADDTSRLACQIAMSERLHGLELEVAPESLVTQTYWVAG
jgi:2Fe-2S ferredoxin